MAKKILTKKLKKVLSQEGSEEQLSIKEFFLLNKMFLDKVDRDNLAYCISSERTTRISDWDSPIPIHQYSIVGLEDEKRICMEFSTDLVGDGFGEM